MQHTILRIYALAWWSLAGSLAVFTLSHLLLDDSSGPMAALHAVAGYAFPVAVLVGLSALLWPDPARGTLAAALFLSTLLQVAPGNLTSTSTGAPADIRVVTANLLMVNNDRAGLIDELAALDADVLVVEELNGPWAAALTAAPQLADYHQRLLYPEDGSFGIGVLSRLPMTAEVVDLLGVARLDVSVTTRAGPLRIVGVHTLPPRNERYTARWFEQMGALADLAAEVQGPTIFVGDLNATRHHPSYKRLLAAGLRDAHAEVGRASATTWPNGVFPLPPLRLDHVLLGGGVQAEAISEGLGTGSDHRPVIADLRLPARATDQARR